MTEEKKEREDRNEFAFDDPSGVAADFARARDADAKDGGSRFGETRGEGAGRACERWPCGGTVGECPDFKRGFCSGGAVAVGEAVGDGQGDSESLGQHVGKSGGRSSGFGLAGVGGKILVGVIQKLVPPRDEGSFLPDQDGAGPLGGRE